MLGEYRSQATDPAGSTPSLFGEGLGWGPPPALEQQPICLDEGAFSAKREKCCETRIAEGQMKK
jgi:hypothetical protein